MFITPAFRRVVLATITFIVLWVLTITIVLALECRPIAKFWDPTIPGKCFNLVAFSYFTNISNLVTDVWIFLLPLPVIWRLQISNHQRIGLCCVFLIGLGCASPRPFLAIYHSSSFRGLIRSQVYHTDSSNAEHASSAPSGYRLYLHKAPPTSPVSPQA